jgi:hypothetical protein
MLRVAVTGRPRLEDDLAQALDPAAILGLPAEELPRGLADGAKLGGVAAAVPAHEEVQAHPEALPEAGSLELIGGDGP